MSDIDVGAALGNILAGRDACTGEKPPASDAEIANLAADYYRLWLVWEKKMLNDGQGYPGARTNCWAARDKLFAALARRPDLIG